MKNNKLLEIGSKANVVLRFRVPIEINGRSYAAQEPYLFFKDANVLINYSNEDKSGSAARTVIASSQINPRSVSIGNISLSKKLMALLTTLRGEEDFNMTLFQTSQPEEDGTIYLNNILDLENFNKIFVYEEGTFNKVGFDLDTDGEKITLIDSDLDLTKTYLISYPSVMTGLGFDLQKTHVPYLSLEIQGVGNVDKEKKNIIMYFDKVSLNSLIDFTFIQDRIINVPLEFHIIENKNNSIWIED